MKIRGFLALAACLALAISGCTMCSSCDDDAYGAYGGLWQRVDRFHGRVGSAFTDVGVEVLGDEIVDPDDELAPPLEPTEAPRIDEPGYDAAPVPVF